MIKRLVSQSTRRPPLKIGIVGAGAAGLRAAMLLKDKGHQVHLFEATGRTGGRIFTHYFNAQRNQYFEAGAMRVPKNNFQKPFFSLVEEVNSRLPSEDDKVELIPYILENRKNFVFVNRVRHVFAEAGIGSAGNIRPIDVDWPKIHVEGSQDWNQLSVQELLHRALTPLLAILRPDPWDAARFWQLVESVDHLSFRAYLQTTMKWPSSLIDFVETIASQTNQYALSTVELVMQNLDFGTTEWKTIKGGMDRLPQAMEKIIGLDKITFNAAVTDITELDNGLIRVHACGTSSLKADFDKLIIAIPSASLRMLQRRPDWPNDKEVAIRAMHSESLWKMGLRFKTRFWERSGAGEQGGQSVTDLPIRWVVLPSNGIGDTGPGVLLVYAWMTDSQYWLPLCEKDRQILAIKNLSRAYPNDDVEGQLIETYDVTWSTNSSTGDAMFFPGHWAAHFKPACRREGNIHFAGEHLSFSHTWISGALESADRVVNEIEVAPRTELPASLHYVYCHTEPGPIARGGISHKLEVKPTEDIPQLTRTLGKQSGPVMIGPKVHHLSGPTTDPGNA